MTPTVTVSANPSGITTAQSTTVFVAVDWTSEVGVGTVTLSSGSYNSGTQQLSGGDVFITIPAGALAIGTDTLTAAYTSTSSSFNNALGTGLVVVSSTVISPAVSVSLSAPIITPSQSVTATITASGVTGSPTPTGSITLTSGNYNSGVQTLVNGSVQIVVPGSSLASGSDALTATYTPDSNSASTYTAAVGRAFVLVSSLITPTVTVSAFPSVILGTQSSTITVSVSGGSGNPVPIGNVEVTCAYYDSQPQFLNSVGVVTVQVTGNVCFGYPATLTATYTPEFGSTSVYNPTSGTGSLTVTSYFSPTITVSANPSTITTAQGTTVTVSVTGPAGQVPPQGSVDLSGSDFEDVDFPLSNGSAQFTIPPQMLPVGTNTFTSSFTPIGTTYFSGEGSGTVTVTAAPGTFLNVLNLPGVDLAWDSTHQKIYVAVPAGAATNPGSVTVVDPIAGAIGASVAPSAAPSGLAISSDDSFLYAAVNNGASIQRYTLPGLASDIQWSMGSTPAGDIKVEPGAPHTVAVSMGSYGAGTVAVYDDGVVRPATATSFASPLGNSLQWSSDGSRLFAIYGLANDAGYELTSSNLALSAMPVTSNGVGAVTTYPATFQMEGLRSHLDPTTNYLYDDWGEVANPANGTPIGNYRMNRNLGYPGPLTVVDPQLGQYYSLSTFTGADGKQAVQIQVFNQTQFQLLGSLVIPDVLASPTNMVRWGQSGLAFVTGGAAGQLYLLEGTFVNPAAGLDTNAGNPIDPVPTITAITPLTANPGYSANPLTVIGINFTGHATIYANGTALPTTLVSSTQVEAEVPTSSLTAAGVAQITASNGSSAFPGSNSLPFSVDPYPPNGDQVTVYSTGGSDLVWDASRGRIYVSMPGAQGSSGDAIGIVNPVSGAVSSTGFLGSDPDKLSLSDDDQYLYVGLNGANEMAQLSLSTLQVNAPWTVGAQWNVGGEGTFDGPYYPIDIQVAPAASQTTAVVLGSFGISPPEMELQIYDGAIPRPNPLQVAAFPYSSLQWAGNDSTLYSVDGQFPQDFLVLGVSPSGATLSQHYNALLNSYSPSIHYDNGTGLVYTDSGQVIQPSNGTIAGSFGMAGIVVPDSTLNRVYILGQTSAQAGTTNYTIQSFNQTTFAAVGSMTISNVVGTPTGFIRWGSNGLAFTTLNGSPIGLSQTGPGQIYVVTGTIVTQ